MKKAFLYLLLLFLFISLNTGGLLAQNNEEDLFNQNINFEEGTLKAKILEVETQEFQEGRIKYRQKLKIEIISDQYSEEIMTIENNIMRNSIYGENLLEQGDRILLAAFYENGELVDLQFQDLLRERALIYLGLLSLILL